MSDHFDNPPVSKQPKRKKYVRAVGPRLRVVLYIVFALVAILGANSAYLLSITVLENVTGLAYQNYFYQYMFLGHLVLGLLFVIPFLLFGIGHIKNAYNRPNRRAVRVGLALFTVSLVLLITGFMLMRLEFFEIRNPRIRDVAYWAHILAPVFAVWLYILHRLAGPKIKWKVGFGWIGVVGLLVIGMIFMHAQDPRQWNVQGPKEGEKYFRPSLARTASGNFIPAKTMMMDEYCKECHPDNHAGWLHSAHHFSSFNNPPYLFSVRETREVALKRDGDVRAARWCAGCHDAVPFFSGAFDNPEYDDVNDPTSQAGITCTACHAITHIGSTRGNADYTIEEPIHYPFAFSDNAVLQKINRLLVKAKPEFHKKTFLKPLHKTPEFCSTCHKVSIPFAVNHYKEFLRGQNHYDSYHLSGVSGHGARSFYYPPVAQENCNGCHMPLKPSDDFGAKFFDPENKEQRFVHDHLFVGANTGIAHLKNAPEAVKAHQDFLKESVRIDIFGLKPGGTIDSPLIAPLRPEIPELQPGKTYLLEVVLRTLTLGHHLTQGTVDSNELWVDVTLTSGKRVIGRSGGLEEYNRVDPWSHFVNVYMLDREGNRIDRRNPQDIFTPLYNHQIPPGAGQVVHYVFTVPEDVAAPIQIDAEFNYRKFDTTYLQYVFGENYTNNLPIVTMATDRIVLPVAGVADNVNNEPSSIVPWQRWNDYGIGLLMKGDEGSQKGELIQAADAFAQVEALGQPDGPINLARVYIKEGRLNDAIDALGRAARFDPPARRWTLAWLSGVVNKQNGLLDQAIKEFASIIDDRYPELVERKFDFSLDYVVLNELGQAYFERSKMERGETNRKQREFFMKKAVEQFEKTLSIDSENLTAHYNLSLIHAQLGNSEKAEFHRAEHLKYKPDDNARDRAIAIHRRNHPAADHAAQAIVLYPLQRPGAPELEWTPTTANELETARLESEIH